MTWRTLVKTGENGFSQLQDPHRCRGWSQASSVAGLRYQSRQDRKESDTTIETARRAESPVNTTKTAPPAPDRSDDARASAAPRLTYLLSVYPGVSHTFLLNEIYELRKLGFMIDIASINSPDEPSDGLGARELEECKNTLYIKSINRPQAALRSLKIAFAHPVAALCGLRAALSLDPWNFSASIYSLFYLAEALILGDWMRRRGHDRLHVHFGGSVATVGMLASVIWKIPYSITVHGPDEFYDVDTSHLRMKVEQARLVICISDYCRSQLMKVCDPAHWSKLRVIRLGVDPEFFSPASVAKESSTLEIVCVGRLVPSKGQLILLRAMAELLQRGYPLRLRLIGDGCDRPRLEAFIREHGLGDFVVLEGARSHEAAKRFLEQADIFVLASFAEGLPVALMEAMAMEVACVSTYVAGIPELIRDGLDGLLVPPSSHQALAAAVERLVVDPGLRRGLAVSGRRRVVELYNLQQNVGILAATLAELNPAKSL